MEEMRKTAVEIMVGKVAVVAAQLDLVEMEALRNIKPKELQAVVIRVRAKAVQEKQVGTSRVTLEKITVVVALDQFVVVIISQVEEEQVDMSAFFISRFRHRWNRPSAVTMAITAN